MKEKFSVAFIGCGEFARHFVPLFQKHPYVGKVYACDLLPERAKNYAEAFGVEVISSFEEVLHRADIDAVAIFAQRHLHGPLVIKALEAGKHVYSAVPMAGTVEECGAIIEAVKKSHKVYMMGETCVYYPCSMFCKREYQKGTFGRFVYGESQYHHDLSHFSENFRKDRPASGTPPFFYPTHSTAMLLEAIGDRVVKVTGVGYKDTEENTPFAKGENLWDNEFSDEFSLMQLAGGGTIRVNECRRIGYKAPSSYVSAFYGTKGAYQFHNAQHLVTALTEKGVELHDVSEQVNPVAMTKAKEEAGKEGEEEFFNLVANHYYQWTDASPMQDETARERTHLTQEFMDQPSGHMNSHRFLVDDFCSAVHAGKLPPVNAWKAARFTVPGLTAHESALRGGELMDVQDFGDAPEDFVIEP